MRSVTSCGHTFCYSCANRWLRQAHSCAICRQPANALDIRPNVAIGTIVRRIRIRCQNDGCTAVVHFGEAQTHQNKCGFAKIECQFPNCSVAMLRGDIGAHEESCPHRIHKCDNCEIHMVFADLMQHEHDCIQYLEDHLQKLKAELAALRTENNQLQQESM